MLLNHIINTCVPLQFTTHHNVDQACVLSCLVLYKKHHIWIEGGFKCYIIRRHMFHLCSSLLQCDSMILSSTPTVRRGSTPLPIKHQLRREEAVHDDCDWTGAAGTSASPISFSPALDDSLMVSVEGRPDGPLKIALLGQNGVGKSSLAIALAGDMDRTASVDSDGTKLFVW